MSDVPEADALEQSELVDPDLEPPEPPSRDPEAPEADALEQAQAVPDPDPERP